MASEIEVSRRLLMLTAALSLAGCGGGGGSAPTSSPTPPPPPPTPSAGWGSAQKVRTATWGGSSGAMMADGAVLMLTDMVGEDPEVLSAVRIDANGAVGQPISVQSFANPFNGARPHFFDSSVTAATDDGGYIAWREPIPNGRNSGELERLQVCRYRASGGLQAPAVIRAMPTGSVSGYSLAALPSNGAIVAWIESLPDDPDFGPNGPTSLYVATYSDASGWSAATQLTTTTPDRLMFPADIAIGTSPLGHVAVLWSETNVMQWSDTLMASNCAPGGPWSVPTLVYATNDVERSRCSALGVAADGLGNAVAVWEYRSWDQLVHRSAFNRLSAGMGWQGAADISEWAVTPSVVVNAAGNGLIVFSHDGVAYGVDFGVSGFGSVKAISAADPGVDPQVSIGADGCGVAMWKQIVFDHGEHYAVYGARFTPAEGWSKGTNVSAMPEVAALSHLTNLRGGRGAVIWRQAEGGGNSSFWMAPVVVSSG
jgi:hypothetical protein